MNSDQIFERIDTKPGDAVVDFAMCFPDLEWLRREFDVLYFCDLCAGIEAAVLNERLFGMWGSIGPGALPVLEPLAEAGVLHRVTAEGESSWATTEKIMRGDRVRDLMARLRGNNRIASEDMPVYSGLMANATALPTALAMEELLGMPLALSAQALPVYVQLPTVRRQREVFRGIDSQFANTYDGFRQALEQLRTAVEPDTTVLIPPIALEALSRASTFDELGTAIVELRHKYRRLRARFTELDETLRLKNYMLRNKRSELARLLLDINKTQDYMKSVGVPMLTEIADNLGKVFEAAEGAVNGATDWSAAFKLGKAAGPLAQVIERARWRLRMRPLLQTIDRYLSMGSADMANAAKVLFGHELDGADLARATAYKSAAVRYLALPRSGAN